MRRGLGDQYVEALFATFEGRVPRNADFVVYWHEKARAQIEAKRTKRAGLLATQGIRHAASRPVLDRMKETGDIFFARSDEPWVLQGAAVHISFIGQDDGSETNREVDGRQVGVINANLTAGLDVTRARPLAANSRMCFMSDTKGGPFEIDANLAAEMLAHPNPDGRSNADVIRPSVNAADVAGRRRDMWIIDFGVDMPMHDAALYEAPFEHVRRHVLPVRAKNARQRYRDFWWLHAEPRPGMRSALKGLRRYIATPAVARHRLWVWLDATILADHRLLVVAREDDYTFGVLHSNVHEIWALATGSQLREVESGFTYTPSTCFETFPFPQATGEERDRVGEAARRIVELRDGWLNPSGLASDELAKRTLTNLYNQRPTWLVNAHSDLDTAVFAAYGWPTDLGVDALLERLLTLNLERAAQGSELDD